MKEVSKHPLQIKQTCNCQEKLVKPSHVLRKRQPSSPFPAVSRMPRPASVPNKIPQEERKTYQEHSPNSIRLNPSTTTTEINFPGISVEQISPPAPRP
jgi:hypothetical protein